MDGEDGDATRDTPDSCISPSKREKRENGGAAWERGRSRILRVVVVRILLVSVLLLAVLRQPLGWRRSWVGDNSWREYHGVC